MVKGAASKCLWSLGFICSAWLFANSASANVKITAINDISLGTYSGSGDLTGQDDVCVYNSATANYTITVTSTGGSYNLISGINSLPFEVRFKESAGSFTLLSYGVAEPFGGADTVSNSCSGGTNASLQVKILQADLLSVRPGSYTSTLTLLIEPD